MSDLSDVSECVALCNTGRLSGHHIVVMDPPWQNKSAKRARAYSTMEHSQLEKLPVPSLACQKGCCMAVWVTNDPKHVEFLDMLFARWGFVRAATWYWLKVTCGGSLVQPLDSLQRKPYEMCIIATKGVAPDGNPWCIPR